MQYKVTLTEMLFRVLKWRSLHPPLFHPELQGQSPSLPHAVRSLSPTLLLPAQAGEAAKPAQDLVSPPEPTGVSFHRPTLESVTELQPCLVARQDRLGQKPASLIPFQTSPRLLAGGQAVSSTCSHAFTLERC